MFGKCNLLNSVVFVTSQNKLFNMVFGEPSSYIVVGIFIIHVLLFLYLYVYPS